MDWRYYNDNTKNFMSFVYDNNFDKEKIIFYLKECNHILSLSDIINVDEYYFIKDGMYENLNELQDYYNKYDIINIKYDVSSDYGSDISVGFYVYGIKINDTFLRNLNGLFEI